MNISRKEFFEKSSSAAAALMLSPLLGAAKHFTPQRKLKLGVIGCGSVSNVYLPHLSKSPYVELVSTCDIRYERAQKQASKYNIESLSTH